MATPAELITDGQCYACYGDLSLTQMITLAQERRVLLNLDPDADATPQGLLAYAQCYLCNGPMSMFEMMELALLDKISQAST